MTTEELKNITSDFNEIKILTEQKSILLGQTNKIRRKLKTQLNSYSFISDLVGIGSNGTLLVNSIVRYFKEFGFDKVENVDKKFKDEDIRLWFEDILIVIEVTGISTPNPTDDKSHQISKHIRKRQNENPTLRVFGLFIVNHDNNKPFNKREKKPFRKDLHDIAKSNNYTLTTTVDLLNAFLQFKKSKLPSSKLITQLCSTGILKILGT